MSILPQEPDNDTPVMIDIPHDVRISCVVGECLHFDTGRGVDKLHILAIVDDFMVVHKSWDYSRKRWAYRVESMRYFDIMREFIVELQGEENGEQHEYFNR